MIRLATPNGTVDADKVISFSVPDLGEPIDAYIMQSSSTVMSIGRRCMTLGYQFILRPYKKPIMITAKGRRIVLEVIDYVPYLPITKSSPCAPGPFVPDAADEPLEDDATELGAHDGGSYEVANVGKRDLKAEAFSVRCLLAHLPKNPHCDVCARAKGLLKPTDTMSSASMLQPTPLHYMELKTEAPGTRAMPLFSLALALDGSVVTPISHATKEIR